LLEDDFELPRLPKCAVDDARRAALRDHFPPDELLHVRLFLKQVFAVHLRHFTATTAAASPCIAAAALLFVRWEVPGERCFGRQCRGGKGGSAEFGDCPYPRLELEGLQPRGVAGHLDKVVMIGGWEEGVIKREKRELLKMLGRRRAYN